MSNGIRASLSGFKTQVIPGRCMLYLVLAIACFGLLFSEAYVIGQPINSIDVDREIAKIRDGEYSKIPLPEEDKADDDETVTYEFRNETERKLLVLLKGRDKRALIAEPDSSASTDVRPGSYEVAVRGWADDEHSVKPWYTILRSAGGMLYRVKFSAVTVYPCSIIAGQYHSVPGRPIIFRGSVDSRVLNEYELEQAEYKFFFGDGTVRDWSKEASAEHVYSRHGIYEAALEVRSRDKDYTSRRVIITVEEPIAVSLRARPVEPETGRVVIFSAIPEGDTEGIEYKFDFGDGNVREWSSEVIARYVYDKGGHYSASVKARLDDMVADSSPVAITVITDYKVAIYARLRRARQDDEVVFREGDETVFEQRDEIVFRAVVTPEARGASFRFDFGDNSPIGWTEKSEVEHEYSSPGRYTPYVIARIGERTFQSGKITINVEPKPIAVSLRARPVKPKTGQVVVFSAIREVDIEGLEYRFDFGDRAVRDWSSKATAKHAYDKEGEYSASVKARLGDVAAGSRPVTIQVMIDYEVSIYAKSQRSRQGDEIVFREGDETVFRQYDEIVFGAIVTPEVHGASFRFDFGDNLTTVWTEKSEVEYAYSSPGEYTPYVIAKIGEITLQSGKITINIAERTNIIISIVKHPMFGIILILLLLLVAVCYFLSRILARILGRQPNFQINPRGDPGIQQVESDIYIQSYPEIRLRSVLEPDKDRIKIEVSLTAGEEVEHE